MMNFFVVLFLSFFVSSFVCSADTIPESKEVISSNIIEDREAISHHTLLPPFIQDWWGDGIPHWDFGGQTVIEDAFIRLTPYQPYSSGWIWNEEALHLTAWEATVQFRVWSPTDFGSKGIAIWYSDKKLKWVGKKIPTEHFWGNYDDTKGFMIVVNNDQGPHSEVDVIVNNGKPHDVRSSSDLKRQSIISCPFSFRQKGIHVDPALRTASLRIIYMASTKQLTVYVRGPGEPAEKECGTETLDVPLEGFFGFTALTEAVGDIHEIHMFKVRALPDPSHTSHNATAAETTTTTH